MNVAIFASAFHPAMGGVEELCRQLALDYRKNGMDAIIITNRWPRNTLPDFELFEGIPVYRLAIRIPEGDLKMRLTFRLTIQAEMARLHSILKKHKSGLLHIQCVTSSAYHALRAHDALKLPLFVTTQGERVMDAGKIFETSPLMNDLLRELYDKAAFISACSKNTLDDAEQFYGKPFGADRARVIYNGIALKDFENVTPYPHPKPFVLGIGRSVPQKGFDLLLRAYAQSGITSHDLLLAGDGPERPALEQLARDLKLGENVKFLGRAERPVAVSLFKGCSFFVLPSRLEPQGIVNLEAMACGKAVVASKVGGVPEIVLDGETGLLFPGENVSALSAALTRMVSDENLRAKMGAAGRARAESFDWSMISEQYRDIYRQILARR
jgi:glycogen(starch) synthase